MKLLIKFSTAIFILSTIAVAFASQKNQFIPTNTLYGKKTVYWQDYGYEEITYVVGSLNYDKMTCVKTATKRFYCFIYTHIGDNLVYRTACRFVEVAHEVRITYRNWLPKVSYVGRGRSGSSCSTNLYHEYVRGY